MALRRAVVQAHMDVVLGYMVYQRVDELADGLGRHAVVGRHEFPHPAVHVAVGLPHQLREDVVAQLAEFAGEIFAVALLKEARYAVLQEELDILLQHMEVGHGVQVMPEVGGVVPHMHTVADLRPVPHVVLESLFHGQRPFLHPRMDAFGQRVGEAALDGADPYCHIGRGTGLRRMA